MTIPSNNVPAVRATLAPQQSVHRMTSTGVYPRSIAQALVAIKRKIAPVGKEGTNKFHAYKYVKSEDVIDEVMPLLAEHGLIITQSEVKQVLFQEERTLAITYEYTVINSDGEVWPDRIQRTGLAWVRDSKGTVDDKASNKCSTQSEKYFYIKFFGIRTSDAAQEDNDGEQRIVAPKPGTIEAQVAGPRVIPAKGSYAEWTDSYIAAVKTAASAADVGEFAKLNETSLGKIERGSPDDDERIRIAVSGILRSITATGVQTTPQPPKPPRPMPPKPTEPMPMPNPTDDLEGFKAWVHAKLLPAQTGEELETIWNNDVGPRIDSLFPPDQEDAMGIYRQHERRLAP
jgi:hypothetical protein